MTTNDVMFIFDTKGDYYNQFYRRGDIVISNDERATDGTKANYWNLFHEITIDSRNLENTVEIVKAILLKSWNAARSRSFPTQRRICSER